MTIRARIILSPDRVSMRPIAVTAAETAQADFRIHQTGESELGFVSPVWRQREVVVFHPRVFTERPLEGTHGADGSQANRKPPESLSSMHRFCPPRLSLR